MFYGHCCAHGRPNGPSDLQRYWSEVKDETPFRYAHAWILIHVVVICSPTRYQLDHWGATQQNQYFNFIISLTDTYINMEPDVIITTDGCQFFQGIISSKYRRPCGGHYT